MGWGSVYKKERLKFQIFAIWVLRRIGGLFLSVKFPDRVSVIS
jgi:hypothetical protein